MEKSVNKKTSTGTVPGYNQPVTYVGRFEEMIAFSAILTAAKKQKTEINRANK